MTTQTQNSNLAPLQLDSLVQELRQMIDQSREAVAAAVNTNLIMLYWHVGNRIRNEILQDSRGEYGQKIVASVARQLTLHYRKGFGDFEIGFSSKKILLQ